MEKKDLKQEHRLCHVVISELSEDGANVETLKEKVMNVSKNLEPKFVAYDLLACRQLGKPHSDRNQATLVLGKSRLHTDALEHASKSSHNELPTHLPVWDSLHRQKRQRQKCIHRHGKGLPIKITDIGKICISPDLSKDKRLHK